ncbi:MAG: hypothetical protein RMJ46_00235, partial [Bacteroidota bacterium]|nr:hypothetical protein [Bacteroidota bacterium]
NPVHEWAAFRIFTEEPLPVKVEIIDMQGRRVALVEDQTIHNDHTVVLNCTDWPVGVYGVLLWVDGRVLASERFTVMR